MALGAGWLSRCGIGLESLAGTWGTLVAPTLLIPAVTESLNVGVKYVQNNALKNLVGQQTPQKTLETCAGDLRVVASFWTSEFLLYAALAGLSEISGAASPWTHTINMAAAAGTREFGRDMSIVIEQDVSCKNVTGAKINTLTLESSPEGVFWDLGIVGKLSTFATTHRAALAALTYAAVGYNPMLFHHQLVFRIGDCVNVLATGDTVDVSSLSLALDNKLQTDLERSGSGYIAEPVPNGDPELTLNFTVPRYEATTLIDAHKAGTKMQADLVFTGPTCGAGVYSMTINLTTLYITEAPTSIDGEELITIPITCQCCRNDLNTNMAETNAMELILDNGNDTLLAWTA